jgi:hypothetical protein
MGQEKEILEILLYEGLSLLMTTPSSFETIFLINIINRSGTEGEWEEQVIGYPSRPFLKRVSKNLLSLSQENNKFLLPPYEMPGILEIFPLDSHFERLTLLLRRIHKESHIDTNSSFQFLFRYFSWFQEGEEISFPLASSSTRLSLPKSLFSDFLDLLNDLGPRGLLYLLGVRTTIGSVNIVPIDRSFFPLSLVALSSSQGNFSFPLSLNFKQTIQVKVERNQVS